MSKPIIPTDEMKEQILKLFLDKLSNAQLKDGKISIEQKFEYDESDRATIKFTNIAYLKMVKLLAEFESEVAWHGTVTRADDTTFIINDLLVYPQTVTGATVNTDQEAYQQWMMALDDETYNSMRMQAHSHVRMGTSPSGVDLSHQSEILDSMGDEDYYIFMIWNKRMEHTVKIYDKSTNTLYEDKDIDICFVDSDIYDAFIGDAKNTVKPNAPVATAVQASSYAGYYDGSTYARAIGNYGSSYNTSAGKTAGNPAKSTKDSKSEKKSAAKEKKSGKKSSGKDTVVFPSGGFYDVNTRQWVYPDDVDYDEMIFGGRE